MTENDLSPESSNFYMQYDFPKGSLYAQSNQTTALTKKNKKK